MVCRQVGAGGGIIDLLGVDGGGRLVLFELKREFVMRDAVAQVIDYASYLDNLHLDSLNRWITEKSGELDDFQDWYAQEFGYESLESLKPIRIFLVGLDIDDTTERMLRYLVNRSGMDISMLDVDYDGEAIRVEWVNLDGIEYIEYPPRPESKQNPAREERLRILLDRAREFGAYEEFVEIRDLFLENWVEASERIATNITIGLPVRYHSGQIRTWWFVGIIPDVGHVRLRFNPWAVHDKGVFRNLMRKIPYEEPLEHGVGDTPSIEFLIAPDKWITHKKELTQLIQDVYIGWEAKYGDWI